ncbi:hypothetical protein ES705_04606 [subsurface metagenome]
MRIILLGLSCLSVIFIIGCGGSAVIIDSPEITMVVMHETSVTVTWEADTSIENHGDFQGYNVYVSTDSSELLVESAEDLNKINPGTIEDNTYEITDLSQDSKYYIQTRTVNIDNKVGDYNDSVPFVKASPRPEFTVTLKFATIQPGVDDSCAIRFFDATIMADSAMTSGGADMFVFLWGSSPDDSVSFNSPVHGGGDRNTGFDNLGPYGFDDIYRITPGPMIQDYVVISTGDLVIAKTQDYYYAKIHVDTIDTVNFAVTITYAYQNIIDFPYF